MYKSERADLLPAITASFQRSSGSKVDDALFSAGSLVAARCCAASRNGAVSKKKISAAKQLRKTFFIALFRFHYNSSVFTPPKASVFLPLAFWGEKTRQPML